MKKTNKTSILTSIAVYATALMISASAAHAQTTGSAQEDHSAHTGHQQQQQSAKMPYDLHFIDMMTMHHKHGVEMAKLAEEKAENARVKAFAQKTRADQEKDISELQAFRAKWYQGQPEMAHHGDGMPGGMSHEEMQKMMARHLSELRENSGHGFDHQFVDLMAGHHKEGIAMAKDATARAEHAEVKSFARNMIAKQEKETGELNQLRSTLKGSHHTQPAKRSAKRGAAAPASGGSHAGN